MRVTPKARFVLGRKSVVFRINRQGEEPATLSVLPCPEAEGFRAEFDGGGSEASSEGGENGLRIQAPRAAPMA